MVGAAVRTRRDVRLISDAAAGLADDVGAEIRRAAHDLILARSDDPAIAVPDAALLVRMMTVCLGETVAPEYAPMMLQELGFVPDTVPDLEPESFSATIIGAGVSGLVAAIRLKQAGIPFRILEKNTDVGGTWLENTYPDCGVDTPNHFYSYSFAINTEWQHYFSLRDEIHQYLSRCVDEFDIRSHIEFDTTVRRAEWDEAEGMWVVTSWSGADRTSRVTRSRFLISAVGQLNRPNIPTIAGLETFAGPCFHSARWQDDVELEHRRVGVIGVGASAMQFVPRIAPLTDHLTIFQRSKQWSRPIGEYRAPISEEVRWLIRHVPFYAAWMRFTMAWRYGDGLYPTLKKDPEWPHPERSLNRTNDRHRAELTEFIRSEVGGDEELLEKTLPTYPPYAKRMLIDNGWYRTLTRDNVELVTEGIDRAVPEGLIDANGTVHTLDVLILATGFKATDILGHIDVRGRNGATLKERWAGNNPKAYLGMVVPQFPNLFVMYGPNTNLAHGGSIIFQAECQMRYIMDLLAQMSSTGATCVEVREDVHDRYNDRVDEVHQQMVWTHPGVAPWYRNDAGRVVSNSPWRLVDYWHLTRHARLEEYLVSHAAAVFDAGAPR